MVLTQKHVISNIRSQKAAPSFTKLHNYLRIISNTAASAVTIVFLTLFSDFYSPLKHPHIR